MNQLKLIIVIFALIAKNSVANTLEEVVNDALLSNPEVLTAQANYKAAEQQLKQARAGYMPSVDIRGGTGIENSENSTTRANNQGSRTLNRRESSLVLNQLIYDGWATPSDVKEHKARVEVQRWRLIETQQNIALKIVEAYLEIQRIQALQIITKESLVAHQGILQKTQWRLETGVGQNADVMQASGRHSLVNATLINLQRDLQQAQAQYYRLTGQPAPMTLAPILSLSEHFPQSLEQAKDCATINHPALLAATIEIEANRAVAREAKGKLWPELGVELGTTHNIDIDGINGSNDDASALIVMRYNLFKGGADIASIREAAQLEIAAVDSQQNALRVVNENVERVWAEWLAQGEALEYLQQHRQSSSGVLEAYHAQFELGRRTLFDLLNAENELLQAKSAAITGEYGLLAAQYRLMASVGRLLSVLGM